MIAARHLQIVVCGAGPAADVTKLISIAQAQGWTAAVTATPAALDLIDVEQIEETSGYTVRSSYQPTDASDRVLPSVDALIIAPATFNTINKLALGIADTYALTSAAELIGRGVPTAVVPFVNSALASRVSFGRSVDLLRGEGIQVIFGAKWDWQPHPPSMGSQGRAVFPWTAAFELVDR